MKSFHGERLSWNLANSVLEVTLEHRPCNEIGLATLDELEHLVRALDELKGQAAALVITSGIEAGFSAGADLRELYLRMQGLDRGARTAGVRDFLERIHRALNAIDAAEVVTIAAVEGICFGGGLELALVCDLIICGLTARFCFPELRLGLIPGFGGIPRLKRDVGNATVRDMLFTGRSINGARARQAGLVSHMVAEGQALRVAREAARQAAKFELQTVRAAKRFLKPIPYAELRQEIELFTELFNRPGVEENLRKFVESSEVLPYLP